jgi:hypothetical protein
MENTMMSGFRHAAAALTLLGGVAIAQAQVAPSAPAPAPQVAPSEGLNTGVSTTQTIDPKAGLRLTSDQRAMVRQSVSREKNKVKAAPSDLTATIGTDLPPSLELYHMPDAVVAEIPNAKLYKYTLVRNDVLVVDPTKMRVVDVIGP